MMTRILSTLPGPTARIPQAAAVVAGSVLITALTACNSHMSRMPSERELEPYAELMTQHDAVSFATTRHPTVRGDEPEIQVAVHEAGAGDKRTKLVALHGVFTDSEAWRYLVPSLTEQYDWWLVDSPGCGESDAPNPARLAPDGYSPVAMADRILQALQHKLRDEPADTRLVLVAHSLGGALAIRMLADPDLVMLHDAVLSRVDRAILFAPLDVAQHKADEDIKKLATVDGLVLGLGSALGYVQEQCVIMTARGFANPDIAPREEAAKRFEILQDPARRKAMQAQLLQAVPFDHDFRPQWEVIDGLAWLYPQVEVPVLLVWGAWDEVLPVAKGYMFERRMPSAELLVVPRAKHSVQLERPRWAAHAIGAFIEGTAIASPGPMSQGPIRRADSPVNTPIAPRATVSVDATSDS